MKSEKGINLIELIVVSLLSSLLLIALYQIVGVYQKKEKDNEISFELLEVKNQILQAMGCEESFTPKGELTPQFNPNCCEKSTDHFMIIKPREGSVSSLIEKPALIKHPLLDQEGKPSFGYSKFRSNAKESIFLRAQCFPCADPLKCVNGYAIRIDYKYGSSPKMPGGSLASIEPESTDKRYGEWQDLYIGVPLKCGVPPEPKGACDIFASP